MTLPDAVAYFAILALALAFGNVVIACWLLLIFCAVTGLNPPANARNFIQTWAGRMRPDGTLERRAHNAGAPQRLTDQMAEEAYRGIIGWRAAQRRNPYESKEQMAHECPAVAKVLRESGVTVDTLIRRIKAKHPNFRFVKLKIRFALTDAHKADRLSKARQLLQGFADLLHCAVFLDQKLINMWEQEISGWVDTSVPHFAEGIKPAKYHGKIIKLKYYAAVHCKLGAFFIRFYTGTTSMDSHHDGNHYKVSSGHEQLRTTPTLHMSNNTRQLLSPPGGLGAMVADHLIHPQPQHTPTLPQGLLSIKPVLGLSVSQATISVVGLCQQSTAVACPCISINSPRGTANVTSQRFASGYTRTPPCSTGFAGLLRLCASTAYSSISGSASHNSYNTLSQLLPLPPHTAQRRAFPLWLAVLTPKNTTCFVPGWQLQL